MKIILYSPNVDLDKLSTHQTSLLKILLTGICLESEIVTIDWFNKKINLHLVNFGKGNLLKNYVIQGNEELQLEKAPKSRGGFRELLCSLDFQKQFCSMVGVDMMDFVNEFLKKLNDFGITLVVGQSGNGKSFFVNQLLLLLANQSSSNIQVIRIKLSTRHSSEEAYAEFDALEELTKQLLHDDDVVEETIIVVDDAHLVFPKQRWGVGSFDGVERKMKLLLGMFQRIHSILRLYASTRKVFLIALSSSPAQIHPDFFSSCGFGREQVLYLKPPTTFQCELIIKQMFPKETEEAEFRLSLLDSLADLRRADVYYRLNKIKTEEENPPLVHNKKERLKQKLENMYAANLPNKLGGIPAALVMSLCKADFVTCDSMLGGLLEERAMLQKLVITPLSLRRNRIENLLLFGPSGNGKTLLAHYLGNYCSARGWANFVVVKAVNLISKVVGETEENIRNVFVRARERAPSILFLDQIETIAGRRTADNVSFDRILSVLLVELDGIHTKFTGGGGETVFVIGATSKEETLDEAIKRPGRLGYHLNISPPASREEIYMVLKSACVNMPIEDEFGQVSAIAKETVLLALAGKIQNLGLTLSRVSLSTICKEAALKAIRENRNTVVMEDFVLF